MTAGLSKAEIALNLLKPVWIWFRHAARSVTTHRSMKTRVDLHPDKPVDLEFDAPDVSTVGGAVL